MQVDHVADDVCLGFQVGEDVDGGISDEERLRVGGHFQDEHVADAAAAAQASRARDHFVLQCICGQAALL
ncbi:hypothetical protein G6F68_017773 [Rhizopus microsporus]|nr:hypothetical protein G6F68_017773 [Rhizopus microsporus]